MEALCWAPRPIPQWKCTRRLPGQGPHPGQAAERVSAEQYQSLSLSRASQMTCNAHLKPSSLPPFPFLQGCRIRTVITLGSVRRGARPPAAEAHPEAAAGARRSELGRGGGQRGWAARHARPLQYRAPPRCWGAPRGHPQHLLRRGESITPPKDPTPSHPIVLSFALRRDDELLCPGDRASGRDVVPGEVPLPTVLPGDHRTLVISRRENAAFA